MKKLGNNTYLVTGGSGTFGRSIIKELLGNGHTRIISISRDEGLIKEAKEWIQNESVEFRVGDICDPNYVKKVLKDVDIIYHTAALKDVPIAEKYPREVLKINILGTLNLLEHSEHIKRFINISSDKAISIVNCYGASKLFAEYLVQETNQYSDGLFISVRCPNLLGSRGSVLSVWTNQLKSRNQIEITDPDMTRFFILPQEAAKFVVDYSHKTNLKSSEIGYPMEYTHKFLLKDLAQAFINMYGNKETKLHIVGKRSGEKIHEDYVGNFPLCSVKELELYLSKISV